MKLKDLYDSIVNVWGISNKGKGLISMSDKVDYKPIMDIIISRILNKTPDAKICIVVDKMDTRFELSKYLNNLDKSLLASKTITLVTENFAYSVSKNEYTLVVFINTHNYNLDSILIRFGNRCRFVLAFSNTMYNNNSIKCPCIYKLAELDLLRLGILDNVLEIHIPAKFNEVEKDTYEKANKVISDTVTVLGGDISIIKKLREGDIDNGLTANQVAYNLAISNGWSNDLDMSIPFMVEIDKIYNPASIQERVSNYYNIVRERSTLETRGLDKINLILDIIRSNPAKKILIISKDADYASDICNYVNKHIPNPSTGVLNSNYSFDICQNLHNKQESIPMIDVSTGEYFKYKSGANKGKIKPIGKKAQHDMSMNMLAKDYIYVLSGQNAMPDYTDIEIDALIITSPMCDNLGTFKYRVANIGFKTKPNVVFKLYNESSREEKEINNILSSDETKVVKMSEISTISIENLVEMFGDK